ncbi:MAG: hypothetical protein Q9181_006712 [Wetmoreana brouardii]
MFVGNIMEIDSSESDFSTDSDIDMADPGSVSSKVSESGDDSGASEDKAGQKSQKKFKQSKKAKKAEQRDTNIKVQEGGPAGGAVRGPRHQAFSRAGPQDQAELKVQAYHHCLPCPSCYRVEAGDPPSLSYVEGRLLYWQLGPCDGPQGGPNHPQLEHGCDMFRTWFRTS